MGRVLKRMATKLTLARFSISCGDRMAYAQPFQCTNHSAAHKGRRYMKKINAFKPTGECFFLLLLVGACQPADRTPPVSTALSGAAAPATSPATTPERFLDHIEILAHDAFAGRDTGERGCDLAAGYIAGQFAALGIAPGGPDGSYFQPFTAEGRLEVLPATFLDVSPLGISAKVGIDFQPLGGSSIEAFAGDVVFVGYGIVSSEYEHDDYAGVDVHGKAALMFRGEPDHLNRDGEASENARWDKKSKAAAEHGAAAMMIVNTNPGADSPDRLSRTRRGRDAASIPKLHITRELANRMLSAGGAANLDELEQTLNSPRVNRSVALGSVSVRGEVAIGPQQLPTQNVLGVLPGHGSHADEYVVIGAHYDHVGVTRGRVYNGADDNASGVSGLIELAAALTREKTRHRSIIFLAFSGEEINLLGSKHFVEKPTVPLPKVKAMLNMDMIGRLARADEANPLQVFGVGTGASYDAIVDRRAAALSLPITKERSALVPTDSAPFYKAGVPALWFFTGLHPDYHQPGDDTAKIDAEGGARIVHYIRDVVLDIVNDIAAPQFVMVDEEVNVHAQSNRGRPRASLGLMPDFDDESLEPGIAVGDVRKTSPAGKAGLRAGDRITAINGRPIEDPSDYMNVMAEKKPGDTVEVSALRGNSVMTFSVELIAR